MKRWCRNILELLSSPHHSPLRAENTESEANRVESTETQSPWIQPYLLVFLWTL